MQAARQAMREACASDAKTLCDGKTGRDAMMCMRDNADKVSQPCKDAMTKMRAARQPSGN
jgi:myo-inositol catabolism protein IolC